MAKKTDDLDKLAEDFIKKCGSKAEAHRRIKASKAKGKPSGRPSTYFKKDAQVLFGIEMLEYERRRAGVKPPKRLALLNEVISREIADGKQIGTKRNAKQRIIKYSSLMEMLSKAYKNHPSGDNRGSLEGLEALPKLIVDDKTGQSLREFWTELARDDRCVLPSDLLENILKLTPNHLVAFSMNVAVLYLSGWLMKDSPSDETALAAE
jgi:hypothetical protein